jgi:hypothetical protein
MKLINTKWLEINKFFVYNKSLSIHKANRILTIHIDHTKKPMDNFQGSLSSPKLTRKPGKVSHRITFTQITRILTEDQTSTDNTIPLNKIPLQQQQPNRINTMNKPTLKRRNEIKPACSAWTEHLKICYLRAILYSTKPPIVHQTSLFKTPHDSKTP